MSFRPSSWIDTTVKVEATRGRFATSTSRPLWILALVPCVPTKVPILMFEPCLARATVLVPLL